MHDIKAIRDNPQAFDAGLARRGLSPLAESLIALDEKRRAAILDLQRAQERRNAASKEIGAAMARKDTQAADDLKAEVAGLKATMPELERIERESGAALDDRARRDPEPAVRRRSRRQGRDRQCRGSPLGGPAGTRRPEQAEGAFRARRGAGPDGLRRRRQAFGLALRRAEGGAGAALARARAVHAGPAHDRARLHRDRAAGAGARRRHVRHGAIAEVP